MLRKLVELGANLNVKDSGKRHPLTWAASSGNCDAILSLINAGADVEARDKDGLTAMHCAASRGFQQCVASLVSLCGADFEAKDKNGSTPLHYSVTLGHTDCTKLLLETFKADPNVQDFKGRR